MLGKNKVVVVKVVVVVSSSLQRCPYKELFCSHNKCIKTPLVVTAGCTGARRLSQAKSYRPECSAQVAVYGERSHCTFASQYLASQHLTETA